MNNSSQSSDFDIFKSTILNGTGAANRPLDKKCGEWRFRGIEQNREKKHFLPKNCFVKRELSFFGSAPKISDRTLIFNFFNFFAAASINRFLVKKCSEAIRVGSF